MFFVEKTKGEVAIIYVPRNSFQIRDTYKVMPAYTQMNGRSLSGFKHLIFKQQEGSQCSLVFFLIHHIDANNSLFLQEYWKIVGVASVEQFQRMHGIQNSNMTCLLKIPTLGKVFVPFVTAFPVDVTALPGDALTVNQAEVSKLVSENFRVNFSYPSIEYKNDHSMILDKPFPLTDDSNEYIVKKGIEYSVDSANDGTIWINLSSTNFARTVKPLPELSPSEPLNHSEHKYVNIMSGQKLPRHVSSVREVRSASSFYETFDSKDAFERKQGNTRFSARKFWFEQTSLKQGVALIEALASTSKRSNQCGLFDELGEIPLVHKIIQRSDKFVFANNQRYSKPAKGLYGSGVLRMPNNMKVRVVSLSYEAQDLQEEAIFNNVTDRVKFLYKNCVPLLSRDDMLLTTHEKFRDTDYRNFFNPEFSYLIYLAPADVNAGADHERRQVIEQQNRWVLEAAKTNRVRFVPFNNWDQYTVANALLKLGLRHGAIPWKIDSISPDAPDHLFCGIDLGHNVREQISNLTITLVDNNGRLKDVYEKKGLPLNEAILYQELLQGFQFLLKRVSLPLKQMTVHRDGIFREINGFKEIEAIDRILTSLGVEQLNLVEVAKSGVPMIGFRLDQENATEYLDGFSGYYLYNDPLSYLITSEQSLSTGTSPVPIKIRRVHGDKDIRRITEEIYWLTKPYSINIFEPSKLPITTLIANNRSYSRDLLHFTSE